MSKSLRLHWLAWQPTPYNNHLFEALARDPEIDFHAHFICPVVGSHPWEFEKLPFEASYFQTASGIDVGLVRQAARDRDAVYVVAGWHDLTMQSVLTARAIRRLPVALWTDTPAKQPRPRVKGFLRSGWLKWIFSRSDVVFGTGAPALAALQEMGCPRERLTSLPFFVPLPSVTRDFVSPPSPLVFASSGRLWNEMKGHDLALAALAQAREATRREDFEYVIAGVGPDERNLRERAVTLELTDHVRFAGFMQPSDLAGLLSRAHVLLHPSRWDPYPVAVLEAMAAGLVVLGSDASGSVQDRIRDGENGFVHHAGDDIALAANIAELLRNRARIGPMSAAAQRTAEEWPVSRGVAIVKDALGAIRNTRAA
jgi:glycosyltransferase involved in cell wall biosynthesis